MDRVSAILEKHETDLVQGWLRELKGARGYRQDLMSEGELRERCQEVIRTLSEALSKGGLERREGPAWEAVRERLDDVSRVWADLGYTPSEVSAFVLLLKRPLFERLEHEAETSKMLLDHIWAASSLLDQLALWTIERFQRRLQDVIQRQQTELLELSTPVVTLWDGMLALPLIGTLDSARAQIVMESLLERIVENGAQVAIIDITGVPTVDTMVAQHLLKAVSAARLMGAVCIISGIRPSIAQTMVQLGVDLRGVITKGTLADALQVGLKIRGLRIVARPATHAEARGADDRVEG